MSKRFFVVGLVALGMFAAAHAEAACNKLGGIAAVVAINPKNTLGTVSGDFKGAILITSNTTQNPDGTFSTIGRIIMISENPSDQLRANFNQITLPTSTSTGYATVQATITSGTGKFEGATGTISAPSEIDFPTGLQSFRYNGEVCTP